jgi:hypothetical protein
VGHSLLPHSLLNLTDSRQLPQPFWDVSFNPSTVSKENIVSWLCVSPYSCEYQNMNLASISFLWKQIYCYFFNLWNSFCFYIVKFLHPLSCCGISGKTTYIGSNVIYLVERLWCTAGFPTWQNYFLRNSEGLNFRWKHFLCFVSAERCFLVFID